MEMTTVEVVEVVETAEAVTQAPLLMELPPSELWQPPWFLQPAFEGIKTMATNSEPGQPEPASPGQQRQAYSDDLVVTRRTEQTKEDRSISYRSSLFLHVLTSLPN